MALFKIFEHDLVSYHNAYKPLCAALFDAREELAERDKVLEQTQERLQTVNGTLSRTEEALAAMTEQRDEARAELKEARREGKWPLCKVCRKGTFCTDSSCKYPALTGYEPIPKRDNVLEQTQERTEEALAAMTIERDKADTLLGQKIRQLGKMRGQRDEARAKLEEASRGEKKPICSECFFSRYNPKNNGKWCPKDCLSHNSFRPIPEEPPPVEYACPECGEEAEWEKTGGYPYLRCTDFYCKATSGKVSPENEAPTSWTKPVDTPPAN